MGFAGLSEAGVGEAGVSLFYRKAAEPQRTKRSFRKRFALRVRWTNHELGIMLVECQGFNRSISNFFRMKWPLNGLMTPKLSSHLKHCDDSVHAPVAWAKKTFLEPPIALRNVPMETGPLISHESFPSGHTPSNRHGATAIIQGSIPGNGCSRLIRLKSKPECGSNRVAFPRTLYLNKASNRTPKPILYHPNASKVCDRM